MNDGEYKLENFEKYFIGIVVAIYISAIVTVIYRNNINSYLIVRVCFLLALAISWTLALISRWSRYDVPFVDLFALLIIIIFNIFEVFSLKNDKYIKRR